MNTAAELDIGPLTWVKGEIDIALEKAGAALDRHGEGADGASQLVSARTHLHQAHGALSIIGLDGVTRFTEALEELLEAAAENRLRFSTDVADAVRRGIAAIRHYLDELVDGQPNQPLRLLPAYRDLARVRGLPEPPPTDLFFPDLSLRPPRRDKEPAAIEFAEFTARAKAARLGFQRGLLKWLKNDPRGIVEMRGSVAIIERIHSQPAARAFWWATMAFLDAVAAGAIEMDSDARRMCSRIDTQIKKLLEGSRTVSERLMRDTLYYVAVAGPAGDHVRTVRDTYRLAPLIPEPAAVADIEPLRPALRACRDLLAQAMDDWNRYCAGTVAALAQFHVHIRDITVRIGELSQSDLSRLASSVLGVVEELRKAPSRQNEAVGIETATALLLLDDALEGFQRLGSEFTDQVEILIKRLAAALRGESLAGLELPRIDELSRRAQEKLLLRQVVKEIKASLGVIEQSLDAFFRDPTKVDELAVLGKPFKQVAGALSILGQDRAVAVLRECEQTIGGFGSPDRPADPSDFELVAGKLSALGFFVEQLQHGPADIDSFLGRPAATAGDEAEPQPPSVEAELEEAKHLTQALVGALREQPKDELLRDEIKQSLEVVRENARLTDDTALAEQADAAIVAIETEQPSTEIEKAVGQLLPAESATVPSPEAVRLAEASSDEIDAELLGIFIEEAHEVIANVGGLLTQLAKHPHDRETLTTIRRGFHTLKGSGRMVGLGELGEAAWAVEQVLNRWLQQELEATPPLQAMLDQAHRLFIEWVQRLESGGGLHHDATALVAACNALKGEPAAPAVTSPPQEPPSAQVSEPETVIAEPAESPHEAEPPAAPALRLVQPAAEDIRIGDLVLSPTLLDLYVTEARDHVATLARELGLPEPPSRELVRAAHTLAGISATTGIKAVNHLAHALENLLNRMVAADVSPTEPQRLLLARAVGGLEGMIGTVRNHRLPQLEAALAGELEAAAVELPAEVPEFEREAVAVSEVETQPAAEVEAEPSPPSRAAVVEPLSAEEIEDDEAERRRLRLKDDLDPQLLPIFLEESVGLMQEIGGGLRDWRGQPDDRNIAESLKRVLHTFKGGARMAGAMGVGELVHHMETRIEQAVATHAVSPAFLDSLDTSFDRVSMLMEQLNETAATADTEAPPAQPEAVAPAAAAPARMPDFEASLHAVLRVRADVVDKLVNEAGEIAIARGRIEGEMRSVKTSLLDLTENVIRLRQQLREIEIHAESQMQSSQTQTAETSLHFDPLEFDRFTRFQELTRMMAESVNDVATAQQSLLQNLDHANAALTALARLNREHSQALMNVRMVPFNTLADRLHRIVRQTAKELGKRANLDIRGGQAELDRSILEKMTGPLEHLLRNAVAHGLETPELRKAAGKPDIGQVTLRVGQEGNEIVLELADDGAGLDLARILARGRETGLIAEDDAPTDEELTQLIFHSGFTTARQVTAVAGRGVGMDVVKNETANMGGRIRVESAAGAGTHFRIYLPLTLAVTQAVLITAGGRHYAIPSSMVAQVSELKPEAMAAVRAEGATTWLGDRYRWHYLPRLLGNPNAEPETMRRYWLLLLRVGDQRIAVEVDELVGNQELIVKNVGVQLARVVGIAGATVLGDGEIVLILNPIALAGRPVQSVSPAPPPSQESETPAAPASAGVVMVVDDSLTVRKITGRLLAREGYHVLTAKDGIDALEQMIDVVPDVMLVDIEMPRMDGFDLTRNVRNDARLKQVPIIMITSRIADKHRNYADEIGVDHYLGKPYDEDDLLKRIAGYIAGADRHRA
jgi:chemosensory pili system protein ChpA (sensor histidine kinase/response regulator)